MVAEKDVSDEENAFKHADKFAEKFKLGALAIIFFTEKMEGSMAQRHAMTPATVSSYNGIVWISQWD